MSRPLGDQRSCSTRGRPARRPSARPSWSVKGGSSCARSQGLRRVVLLVATVVVMVVVVVDVVPVVVAMVAVVVVMVVVVAVVVAVVVLVGVAAVFVVHVGVRSAAKVGVAHWSRIVTAALAVAVAWAFRLEPIAWLD